MPFPASTRYRSWARRLRLSIMGAKGKAILGAFATVIGDKTLDWATQANLEHMPEFASPESVGLIGSERQLEQGPNELLADYAYRLMFATQLWRFAGTPLGILIALHFAGFDGAVLVQQNGVAYQLTLPLPPFIAGQTWDPSSSLVRTATSMLDVGLTSSVTPPTSLAAGRAIPSGNSWWTFDSDTDFCSRFAVLLPGPLGSAFMTWARATFTGTRSAVATWNNAFNDTAYSILSGAITIATVGDGIVSTWVDGSTKTAANVTVRASDDFNGSVELVAYPTGANPFVNLNGVNLSRLKTAITKWKPQKATCVGVYALLQGHFIGWPVRTIGSATPGYSVVADITGSF
jgi:hypothetical protein